MITKQEKDDGDEQSKSRASTPDVDLPCAMSAQRRPTDSKSNVEEGIRVTLEEHLWYQFSNLETEMIITRIGR